ncbi:MAG: DUF5666 domain-containing protein [Candidatus Shapirobacteria bacterium]|nr:DUF5666 domain-containing protein [Candidatus Shapirobacteria bacterium]
MIIFLLFLFSLLTPPQILAVEPTAEPTKTTNVDEIKKIREAVQKKVQEKLQQIVTPSQSVKSSIGTITDIKDNQISLEYQNSPQQILVSDETIYIDTKRNKTKLENLKAGQEILALGYVNTENILETKRIVFTDLKTLDNKKQVVIGKIVDISTLYSTTPIFTLISINDKNNQYQIKTDQNTQIEDKSGQKIKKLASGQKIIVILQPDKKVNNTFYASKIIQLDTETPSPTPTKKENN